MESTEPQVGGDNFRRNSQVLSTESPIDSQRRQRRSGIHYRSVSSGYWVAFLLPLALYIGDVGVESQKQYKTAVSIIIFNVIELIGFRWYEVNLTLLLQRLRVINIFVSILALVVCFINGGNLYEVASYVALNFTFPYAFYNLVKQHPKSFSFGEGVLVTSAFAYMFWQASQNLPFPPTDYLIHRQYEPVVITFFLQLLFFGTVLGSRVILLMMKPWKLFILEEMLCLWSKYCIIAFFTRVPINNDDVAGFLMMWPFNFLFATITRVRLITLWASVSLLTGIYLFWKNLKKHHRTTTIDRKAFHFAIASVFLSGVFWDFNLLYCCSAVVLYLFICLESIRVLKLEVMGFKLGVMLDEVISDFRDIQDEGKFLLTPIYLLVGCSMPIWLTGLKPYGTQLNEIEYAACLSGILSIGIGDTFASIGGTYYGKTLWKDSRKSIEGTSCSIITQIIAIFLIFFTGVIPYNSVSVNALIVSSVINAVIEGNTDQIDNLVLPLVTFISVHAFGYMFG